MQIRSRFLWLGLACIAGAVGLASPRSALAQQPEAKQPADDGTISLAGGKIVLKAPADWKATPPKNSIVQFEFAAPRDSKPESQARITIMGAGGPIAQNIDRWYSQFEQADGSSTKDKAKVEKFDAAGQTVHLVEISGTFKDSSGGPFQRAAVVRENYRMLGAIIETKELGQHFVKITGPAATVEKLKEGFRKMLEGLEVKK
jgi:hypothetical protein